MGSRNTDLEPKTNQNLRPESGQNEAEHETEEQKPPSQTFTVSKPVSVKTQEELEKILKEHRAWIEKVLDPKEDTHGEATLVGADVAEQPTKGDLCTGNELHIGHAGDVLVGELLLLGGLLFFFGRHWLGKGDWGTHRV